LLWDRPAMIVALDPVGFPGGFLPDWLNLGLGCSVALRFAPTIVNPSESSLWALGLASMFQLFWACVLNDLAFATAACLTLQMLAHDGCEPWQLLHFLLFLLHSSVLCCSAHRPHACSALQYFATCPNRPQFRHCVGLCYGWKSSARRIVP
jgi:hypothetical protein